MNMSNSPELPEAKRPKLLPNDKKCPISNEISVGELCIGLRCDPQQVINVANHWNISYWDAIEMVYEVNSRNLNTDWNTLKKKK